MLDSRENMINKRTAMESSIYSKLLEYMRKIGLDLLKNYVGKGKWAVIFIGDYIIADSKDETLQKRREAVRRKRDSYSIVIEVDELPNIDRIEYIYPQSRITPRY